MDDLIHDVGIDGKHSYEDKIRPVEKVMEVWGGRMSVLGGVDMDILARGTEQQVRERVRQILDFCGRAAATAWAQAIPPPTTSPWPACWLCWMKVIVGMKSISQVREPASWIRSEV